MEENNIGNVELSKDLMEDGLRAENRHNLSMDIYSENRRAQTKNKFVLRSITWVSSSSIFSIPLLPFLASSKSTSLSSFSSSSSGVTATSTMFSE